MSRTPKRQEGDGLSRHMFGDLTIGNRPLIAEPLDEHDWSQVFDAYLAFQFQLKLIVPRARRGKLAPKVKP